MEEEDGVGFDLAAIRDWVSYAWLAVRRHGRAIVATTGAVAVAAALVSWSIPDSYYVEARVLAQRPDVLAVVSPSRPLGTDAVAVSRSVNDLVERRDNLVALVDQTGLVQHWRSTRPWRDRLAEKLGFGYELDDEQLREMLVGKLEDSIEATGRDSSVALGLRWEDPEMAFRLMDVALQNFLEMRHVNEMAILGESISLLEERLGEAQHSLDAAMAGVRSLPPPRRGSAGRRNASLDLVRMLSVMAEKRRAMEDVISFRNRRIAELHTRLDEQKAIYAESHPAVENIKRSLEALQADSPQLSALRQELQQDEARYLAEGGSPADLGDSTRGGSSTATSDALIDALGGVAQDPNEEFARSRMATAFARYYSVADRLEALRLQRDAARASIKFRYLVVRPPMRPHQPENRRLKQLILAGGALFGAFLGALAAVGLEVRRGRIDQPWQVERLLGLAVLAEPPALSRPVEDRLGVSAAVVRPPGPPLREQERAV